MFIEPNLSGVRRGWIEVICGSMFSGKTEELIRRLKRVRIAHQKVEIFKPGMDVRFDIKNIVSHDENAILSTPIDNSQTILLMATDVDVVGIDEAQFFDDQLPDVCDQLALRGIRVIVAGLDMDYAGKPFRPDALSACQGRLYYQVTCHLREMWKYCQLLLPQNSPDGAGAIGRKGYVRTPLQVLLP